MALKCVTCTRLFKNIHALKSHQPKCHGRASAHAHGFENPGRKLAQRMDVTEEEVVFEKQELRTRDDSEPARKRKRRHKASVPSH
jgi:hypothetical protein